jgi:hypothetical protein
MVITLFSFGCERDEPKNNSLKGSWIESSSLADTLIFETNEFEGLLYLNRGKELREGHMLPKIGSGPFFYEISEDSLFLRHIASSCSCTQNYSFTMLPEEGKLKVGNFFNDDIPLGELLIFEKL